MIDRTNLRQPHEGIAGVRRADFLLSLDERAVAHRDALIAMALHLRRATLVGNPAPVVQVIHERITNPRIGDLVVESSQLRPRDVEARLKSLGYLLEKRREWWTTDDEWEREKAEDGTLTDEDRSVDTAWYVQYGPDPVDVCRWVDCSFLAIPTDRHAFAWPVGDVQEDGSVVMTRESVLAGLAASGFKLRVPPTVG